MKRVFLVLINADFGCMAATINWHHEQSSQSSQYRELASPGHAISDAEIGATIALVMRRFSWLDICRKATKRVDPNQALTSLL